MMLDILNTLKYESKVFETLLFHLERFLSLPTLYCLLISIVLSDTSCTPSYPDLNLNFGIILTRKSEQTIQHL